VDARRVSDSGTRGHPRGQDTMRRQNLPPPGVNDASRLPHFGLVIFGTRVSSRSARRMPSAIGNGRRMGVASAWRLTRLHTYSQRAPTLESTSVFFEEAATKDRRPADQGFFAMKKHKQCQQRRWRTRGQSRPSATLPMPAIPGCVACAGSFGMWSGCFDASPFSERTIEQPDAST